MIEVRVDHPEPVRPPPVYTVTGMTHQEAMWLREAVAQAFYKARLLTPQEAFFNALFQSLPRPKDTP
jgi:hypothetical protein